MNWALNSWTYKRFGDTFFSFADLEDGDEKHYGLSGSATQVERIFPPQKDVEHEVWTGDDGADVTEKLLDTLKKWKFV